MKARRLCLAALPIIVAGCGATVRSTMAPGANLGQYHTYAFHTPSYRAGATETLAEQELRSALRNSLAERGLREAPPGVAPDFRVAYYVKTQERLNVNYVGYGFWGWGPTTVTPYTEGTLIVDFIDHQTNSVFWRGTARDVVNHPDAPNLRRVDDAVAKLIRQYPSMMAAGTRQAM
jgi:hypothetical protein